MVITLALVTSTLGLGGVVQGTTITIPLPINGLHGWSFFATLSNARYGGGDSLIFDVTVMACSGAPTDTVASVKVGAWSDSNFDANTLTYARVSFHHVIVPAMGCTNVTKLVRVHHASQAAQDNSAYLVAEGVFRRDGLAYPEFGSFYVNIEYYIGLLAPM